MGIASRPVDASEPIARLGGATACARPGPIASARLSPVVACALACLVGLVPEDSLAAGPPLADRTPALHAAPGMRPVDVLISLGAPWLLAPPARATPRRLPSETDPPALSGGDASASTPPPASPAPSALAPASGPAGQGPSASPAAPTSAPTSAPPLAPGSAAPTAEPAEPEPLRDDIDRPAATVQPAEIALPEQGAPAPIAAEPALDLEAPSKFVRGRSVPPFWFDRTYTTHRTRAMALPPLFFHRTPTAARPDKFFHFDLSLTTGWYSQKASKRRFISPAILFFGSFSERTSAWGSVALLMGYKRVGEQFTFGQFPLVWRWGNKQVKNLVVVPFHYHQKTPDSLRGISAILFWYGHKNTTDKDPLNDLRYFIGAPIFYRVTRGPLTVNVGAPLYVGGANQARGLKWHHVFPFVHWQSSEFGNRKDLWTLLWVQRSDKARSRRTWAIPPLLTFSRQTPTHRLFSATPLVWRAENRDKGSVAWSVFPWVSHRDPDQRNRVLFPLFWQFGDLRRKVTSSVFVPLAYARKSPDETRVWTLLGGGSRGKDGRLGFGITPLLTFVRNDPQGRSFQVVTPLFIHSHDRTAYAGKGSRQVVLGPLGFYSRRGERKDIGVIPALSFFGREGTKSYQVVTPLFWHRRESDPARFADTTVLGPLFVHRNRTGFHAGLPPVAVFGRDEHWRYGIVPPLLTGHVTDVKAQRSLTISPVFARSTAPGARTLGVLNLFWDVKRPQGERHTALFPLFYHRQKDGRALTLTPLGGGVRTPEQVTWSAGLVAYGYRGVKDRTRAGFGLVPLVFYDRRPVQGGVASNLVVAPLFARHRAPSEDLDMFTPLVWRTAFRGEKPRKNLAIIPFYFRQRQPDGIDVDAGIVPPFFYSRDPVRRTHTLIAGPFFHRLTRTSLNTGVVPLYWWMDSVEKRRLISLPLIVHIADKGKREHTTIAVPLWFDRRRANGRRSWVALPFVVGVKGQHNFTRFSLLPPLFFDIFRLGRNTRFTGLVPLLFRYQKCGFRAEDDDKCRFTMWGSAPLFLYGRDGKGRVAHGALMLYYFDRDPGGRRFLTLLGGANVRPGERLTWYALNVGHTTTRKFKTTVVFPLFFRKAYRTEDRSTTVALPPLFIERRRQDYRWWEAGLLLWHFRRPHKVTTAVVPPIFYTSHSYAERRLTWLLPLFARDRNWAKDSAFTGVFPALFFQRRRGADNDFVQFPLVWHFERDGKVTDVVPALYTHRKAKGRDLHVLGPGLGFWWRTEKPIEAGTRKGLHWRALFGIIGGGNDGVTRYFSLFGGKIPLKPKPVWEPRRRRKAVKAEAELKVAR